MLTSRITRSGRSPLASQGFRLVHGFCGADGITGLGQALSQGCQHQAFVVDQ